MRSRRCRKWCCVCSRRLRWCQRSTYNQCIRARVRVQWSHCVGTAIEVWRWLCVTLIRWITRQAGQARSHLHLLGQLHGEVHLHVSQPLLIFGCNRKLWTSFGRKRKKTENLICIYYVPKVQFWSFSAPKTITNFGRSLVELSFISLT